MLDELVERYGKGAVVCIDRRYRLHSDHVDTRWTVSIDGEEVPDVDVSIQERGDVRALMLVNGKDELELHCCNLAVTNAAVKEPGRIVGTLGSLKRRAGRRVSP